MFEVLINGESKRSDENTTPAKYDNIKVFAGSPWYEGQKGYLRNLKIEIKTIDCVQEGEIHL